MTRLLFFALLGIFLGACNTNYVSSNFQKRKYRPAFLTTNAAHQVLPSERRKAKRRAIPVVKKRNPSLRVMKAPELAALPVHASSGLKTRASALAPMEISAVDQLTFEESPLTQNLADPGDVRSINDAKQTNEIGVVGIFLVLISIGAFWSYAYYFSRVSIAIGCILALVGLFCMASSEYEGIAIAGQVLFEICSAILSSGGF